MSSAGRLGTPGLNTNETSSLADTADVDDLALFSIMLGGETVGLDPISADGLRREKQTLQIQIEHGSQSSSVISVEGNVPVRLVRQFS
jgi:hypothetical protein